jgi:hypothetical protein
MPVSTRTPSDWIPLSHRGDESITLAPRDWYGWACYWSAPAKSTMRAAVRIGRDVDLPQEDRPNFTIFEVFVWSPSQQSGRRLGRHHLRGVPLNRIEAAVNQRKYMQILLNRAASADCALAAPLLDPLDWNDHAGAGRDAGAWLRRPASRRNPSPQMRFTDESGRKPDTFYIAVSEAFLWLTAIGRKSPISVIAEANNTEETTVHRWLKEARRRRLLMPPMPKSINTGIEDDS